MESIIKGAVVPNDQIDELDNIAQDVPGRELQELLQSLARCLRDGDDIIAFGPNATFTPSQAAERLGMSRTHLYKLLDSGDIPSHRVGRDRRLRVADLVNFEARRQTDRRELAERFAAQQRTRDSAIDELADLL